MFSLGEVVYVLVAADPSGIVYLVDEINAWGFDTDAVSAR